jgi:hypothetical protein
MTSPLLALFGRSVREDTRLKMTYVARIGLIVVILLFLLTVQGSFGWGNAPGLRFFGTVVFINFGFIVLAGFSHFASAVTEEKEEMTLGLLRMTNLNALSILLGKSTSRMVNALLLLAVQLPFTLLAISLGGVAVRQVFAAYCTLAAFIVFLANLALFASVVCRRTTGAAVLTGVTLFVFFAVVPFFRWIVSLPTALGLVKEPSLFMIGIDRLADAVAVASPSGRLTQILGTGFTDNPCGVQVWSNLALGAGFFLLAWAVFDVFCSEQQEAGQPRSLLARRTSRLRRLGAGRVWQRALAWKDFYFLTGGKGWMLVKLVAYAVPGLLIYFSETHFRPTYAYNWQQLGYGVFWIAFIIACVELAFICASFLRHERQWKTLSSLAMLPQGLRRITWQKFLGCLPSLIPAFLYMGLGFVLFRRDFISSNFDWDSTGTVVLFYMAMQFLLFLHLTILLSLYLRRGALPAAIAIHFVWNMLAGVLMVAAHEEAILFLLGLVSAGGVAFVQTWIGRRLERLAEED